MKDRLDSALSHRSDCMDQQAEPGFIMIALLAAVLPLLCLVGASTLTMNARNKGLHYDILQTRAMLAADSGIDEAIWRAANGTLISGTSFTREIGPDQSLTVEPVNLGTDGIDNDGDFAVDEADENVFMLTITGTYQGATRRIAAYLGPAPALPLIEGAIR